MSADFAVRDSARSQSGKTEWLILESGHLKEISASSYTFVLPAIDTWALYELLRRNETLLQEALEREGVHP
jgi:hypothetical protein